jgi:predicted solute-binding protein
MINIFLPNNIFAKIFAKIIPQKHHANIKYLQASLLSKSLVNENADIALIPSFDLLSHPNFMVSERYGISCEGLLSVANIYYRSDSKEINNIGLYGDVTSNEILLPKVIYSEKYSSSVNVSLETNKPDLEKGNYILVGDINYDENYFNKGMSFAEEVTEIINFPYVNYVLASKDEIKLKEFADDIEHLNVDVELILGAVLDDLALPENIKEFIKENFASLFFEITESERFGLEEMLKLPYYQGLVDDMVEINFV